MRGERILGIVVGALLQSDYALYIHMAFVERLLRISITLGVFCIEFSLLIEEVIMADLDLLLNLLVDVFLEALEGTVFDCQ